MEQKKKDIPKGAGMGIGIAIGMACGVIIGILMDQIAIGIAIGSGIGVSIGVALENKRQETDSPDRIRKRRWAIGITVIILSIAVIGFLYLLFRV